MKLSEIGTFAASKVDAMRRGFPRFDHLVRAQERFTEVNAPLQAAAISYYAFFAAFSLSLLALSTLGLLLRFEGLYDAVDEWLTSNLAMIDVGSIEDSARTVGLVALAALIVVGVNWVQAVRASVRGVWKLEQQPGNLILRWIVDMAALIGLGVLLVGTFAVVAGAQWGLNWLEDAPYGSWLGVVIRYSAPLVGVLVNTLLAAALLSGIPRLALPLRRLLPPALLVAIGLELLKSVGSFYIAGQADRPAYQAVGTAVGLLVFLFVFNQMLLFAAAWTATSDAGNAVDMTDRRRIADQPRREEQPHDA